MTGEDAGPERPLRILLVTQMWPGPEDPDLGIFVADVAGALEARGHRVERAAIARRGGPRTKFARLGADALGAARRLRPDVVYAHFLVPAGTIAAGAALAARAPLVLTAHGMDVANAERRPALRAATRLTVRRASAVIAVSGWLRDRLEARVPEARGRTEVIDSGVDLDRFRGRDPREARRALGWEGEGPFFLFVGGLDERKNPLRLAEAFARFGRGQLAVVGDGPLRGRLEGLPGVRLVGRVPHAAVADWIAACDVLCQPSLREPFGQALLEAMAGERTVVATTEGGPPEFVTPEAGVLVDPRSVEAIASGLASAAERPAPNRAARAAAAEHDVTRQAARIAAVLARAAAARP